MWREQSWGRMAKIAKTTKRTQSDLTDEEQAQIGPAYADDLPDFFGPRLT